MNNTHKIISFALLSLASLGSAVDSPWIPAVGSLETNLSYARQSYDRFWLGEKEVSNKDAFGSDKTVVQNTGTLSGRYGINAWLAADLAVGYTSIDFAPLDQTESGINDTRFGVQGLVLDEFNPQFTASPTLSVRLGGIIAGTYDTGDQVVGPSAPGVGSNGIELSAQLGKSCSEIGFGVSSQLGYRWNLTDDVPDALFWSVGAYQSILDQVVVGAAYRVDNSRSGPDIGDPGFTFPAVRQEKSNVDVNLTYVGYPGCQVGVFGSWAVDGRNVGKETVYGLFVGHTF